MNAPCMEEFLSDHSHLHIQHESSESVCPIYHQCLLNSESTKLSERTTRCQVLHPETGNVTSRLMLCAPRHKHFVTPSYYILFVQNAIASMFRGLTVHRSAFGSPYISQTSPEIISFTYQTYHIHDHSILQKTNFFLETTALVHCMVVERQLIEKTHCKERHIRTSASVFNIK